MAPARVLPQVILVKAHAYGNDFLLADRAGVGNAGDLPSLARAWCDRHRGIGADGLLVFQETGAGAAMQLLNADGSASEISGNGIRCLAAWLARTRALAPGDAVAIETEAGLKQLELLDVDGARATFRAAMGPPVDVRRQTLDVDGRTFDLITLRMGNPQCVLLGELSGARLREVAAKLAIHPAFPHGTNVELARVDAPDRVAILIWERGVGPTEASGTGACAAAVAAAAYGGAARDVVVTAPGGAQRVEWREDGIYLTGWAEVLAEINWLL